MCQFVDSIADVEMKKLMFVMLTSCCGPLGRYSLTDCDTPATSRCCKARAINYAPALRCCSQPASRLL